ncbi:MAG: histidinol dehydrogenase, partial [SAR86 cluster bacterium BACL1 MAG-120920-bin57]
MKLINRSINKQSINWFSSSESHDDVEAVVKNFKDLILAQGTPALDIINKQLGLKKLKAFKVSSKEISSSDQAVSDEMKCAILTASKNIQLVCENEKSNLSSSPIETTKGITIWKEFRAIDSVGLYVPGGTAPLISSLLMQIIPATLAGCSNIIICSPPDIHGKISPEILWICKLYNLSNIYKVGGAQAILAMAYGTTIVPQVSKIFGPGNAYVSYAKELVSKDVAIDLPAGPSEVMIVTNEVKNASLAAADALSQLEHGVDSKAFVVSQKLNVLMKVKSEVLKQKKNLKRETILNKSIKNLILIKCKSVIDASQLINECAPEHLILLDEDYSKYLPSINNAGSIFCGSLSPESFGDYASGSNHVLPTNGHAKTYSGLGIKDFGKQISLQAATAEGFMNLKDTVTTLALAEGLDGHAAAVDIRRSRVLEIDKSRSCVEIRKTNETNIYVNLNLDGTGKYSINTGLNFLDHLLEQFSKHSKIDLHLTCDGDLYIDEHHTIEDIAITLGSAINTALSDRLGISRYSSVETLVMDEVKCSVSIDLASRRYLSFQCSKLREIVGDFP